MVRGGSQKKSNVPNTTWTEVEQSSNSQRAISRIHNDSPRSDRHPHQGAGHCGRHSQQSQPRAHGLPPEAGLPPFRGGLRSARLPALLFLALRLGECSATKGFRPHQRGQKAKQLRVKAGVAGWFKLTWVVQSPKSNIGATMRRFAHMTCLRRNLAPSCSRAFRAPLSRAKPRRIRGAEECRYSRRPAERRGTQLCSSGRRAAGDGVPADVPPENLREGLRGCPGQPIGDFHRLGWAKSRVSVVLAPPAVTDETTEGWLAR